MVCSTDSHPSLCAINNASLFLGIYPAVEMSILKKCLRSLATILAWLCHVQGVIRAKFPQALMTYNSDPTDEPVTRLEHAS